MIQRRQPENDIYLLTSTEADAGSITSTMSTTTTNATASNTSSSSSSSKSSHHHITNTSNDIITKPAQFDILCGKDKTYNKHAGNQVFRAMIETWVKSYQQANTKQEKMRITKQIVHSLQEQFEARFLKPVTTTTTKASSSLSWIEISNQVARDKVSHALRFAAKQQTTSATTSATTMVKMTIRTHATAVDQSQPHHHNKLPRSAVVVSPTPPPRPSSSSSTVPFTVHKAPNAAAEDSVESLFQLQQAILLGNYHNSSIHKNSNDGGNHQDDFNDDDNNKDDRPHADHNDEEEQMPEEPEFNTLRSEDLNAIMNEPLELDNDYDTLMSLSR